MYGLVDGPILFQMAFIHYLLTELRFYKSLHDDNFLYKYSYDMSEVICVIVLHVDDLLVLGAESVIRWVQTKVETRFGSLKKHTLPFVWCGIVRKLLHRGHYYLHRDPYLSKLKPIQLCE